MAKFAFKNDVNFGRKLRFEDSDGDVLIVTHDREAADGDAQPFPFVVDVQGLIGLSRKQAVKLAYAILKEAARG